MRDLGHGKESQHVLIKSQSFLSAMKRIISTRREAKIITGKNECSQRKSGNLKVGMSDFRETSFWLCRVLATQRA